MPALSDEDFLNSSPETVAASTTETAAVTTETTVSEKVEETPVTETTTVTEPITKTQQDSSETVVDEKQVDSTKTEQPAKVEATGTDKAPVTDDDQSTAPVTTTETPANYESLYKKIMAPFKADGKMITLKSEEEAIQLMQMGANYTRKLQELQPHRKMMLMLQNNGLMDEEKLSFLIDLDKRNPEAIRKLVKEAGIDPLDIDTTKEITYQTGNHKVTDAEANFRSVLDELTSSADGKSTLQAINDGWDQASKEVLWKQPDLMTTIHAQREAGVYQVVVEEIGRQKMLGALPANTSFLDAYKTVGDKLLESGAFDHLPAMKAVKPNRAPVAVTTRQTATTAIKNGDKASAASPSRSTPRVVTTVNPNNISDEDFLKQMGSHS